MASPTTRQSAKTGTLAQKTQDATTFTNLNIDVVSTDTWENQAGVAKVGTGTSAFWVAFTGISTGTTTAGVTRQTLTGCSPGLKKAATSLTDVDTSNIKANAVGTTISIVHHSAEMNKLVQKDADETLTGSITISNTTKSALVVQSVSTTQRDAFTTTTNGNIIYNNTAGEFQVYQGGSWSTVSSGSTQPDASETVAGKVEIATDAEAAAGTGTGGTGATLVITPTNTNVLMDSSNTDGTNLITIGGGSSGNRSATLDFDVDDTNAFGLRILRNSGVNGTGVITQDGTGDFQFAASDNSSYNFTSTGNTKFDVPAVDAGTAGETLAAGDWVAKDSSDQKLYKADNNNGEDRATVVGVIKVGGATDATVYFQKTGLVTGLSGLTAGSRYYVSATAGALTATRPTISSSTTFPVLVGIAESTTSLTIVNQRIPRQITGSTTQSAGSAVTKTITVGFPVAHASFNTLYYYGPGSAGWSGRSSGVFDGVSGTNNYVYEWTRQSTPYGAAGNSSGAVMRAEDLTDGSGYRLGVASVNGSNDIEIAWTDSGWTGQTIYYTYDIHEAL